MRRIDKNQAAMNFCAADYAAGSRTAVRVTEMTLMSSR
jgi:hypothetical protein